MVLNSQEKEKLDVQKIHAEINQIVNQRYLLTTIAVTIFGVIGAWLIPKDTPSSSQNPAIFFVGSIVLTSILLVLFYFDIVLKDMLRKLSAYLIVTNNSIWERHWQIYRDDKKVTYTKGITVIFSSLGAISLVFPFLIIYYQGNAKSLINAILDFKGIVIFHILFIGFYFSIILMNFFSKFDREDEEINIWREVIRGRYNMVEQRTRRININLRNNWIRWIYFSTFSLFLLMDLFLIGLVLNALTNFWFEIIIQAVFIIVVSLMINFLPSLENIRRSIFESTWKNFLIPIIITIVIFIIVVVYIFGHILNHVF